MAERTDEHTSSSQRQPPARRAASDVALGAFLTVIGVFPVAALVALMFRFPFPMAGYRSGFEAMLYSPVAVAFYGVFTGGFVGLALIGACIGWKLHSPTESRKGAILRAALAVASAAILLLSVWDLIYGPW